MAKIFFAIALLSIIGSVFSTVCRDGSTCPGTTTCCLTAAGVGCCPYENASCCADGLHCCPSGYTCDTAKGACVASSGNAFLSFVSLNEAAPAKLTETTSVVGSFPNITDLLRCLADIKPVASDIYTAITEYKKGTEESKQKAKEALLELAKVGIVMGTDCYKVIGEILKKLE